MVSNPGENEIRKFEFSPNYGIIGVGEKLNLKPYLWKVYRSFFNVRPEFQANSHSTATTLKSPQLTMISTSSAIKPAQP